MVMLTLLHDNCKHKIKIHNANEQESDILFIVKLFQFNN